MIEGDISEPKPVEFGSSARTRCAGPMTRGRSPYVTQTRTTTNANSETAIAGTVRRISMPAVTPIVNASAARIHPNAAR